MKFQFYRRIIFAVTVCLLVFAPKYSSGVGPEECQPNSINVDTENVLLTRTEMIALKDEQFEESLNKFKECVKSSSNLGDVSSGSGTKSTVLQGGQSDEPDIPDSPDEEDQSTDERGPILQGKIPDDIPAPDNDNALQTQIRRAAMQETDPDLKEKLWNEYRKYKGLPER